MLTIDPIPDRLRFTGGATQSDVTITDANGDTVYERRGVIHPETWSATAIKVAASKYLKTINGTPENSIFGLVNRVVSAITAHGISAGYVDAANGTTLHDALTHLALSQAMAFNSPVWFNVGIHDRPQASACFINSLGDSMPEILDFVKVEGMLFKAGSGSGVDLSRLRAKNALLSGGGTASGPVAFMKGLDSMAGVIKSGGGHRRAAAMRILCDWHPDVLDFIRCKVDAEKKAHALIDAGYDGAFNAAGGAYDTVPYQNANHSVAVSAATMARVNDGEPEAVALLTEIASAAWACGDPGVWFVDTVNSWNTVPNHGPIRAPNPCGEFNFPDDTACNLASLNLIKFLNDDNTFDVDAFVYAVRVTILAQEILCDLAGYPTPAITKNSHDLRPLGLGYANLGALLMSLGLPYDSDEARHLAAAITSLMSATAYHQSALLAQSRGPFSGFAANREPMLAVVERHANEARKLYHSVDDESEAGRITSLAMDAWDNAFDTGIVYGYRNAQVTVLAPTGTIGFMMDCDTTGIEPDGALIKYKAMVGGGTLKLVSSTVPRALQSLGYTAEETSAIVAYIAEHDTIEGAPNLRPERLRVFDCALKPAKGSRCISPTGHLKMMASVQPFLSGAISKTVNLPNSATPTDIFDIYRAAHRLGLKAVAVYRDGCKRSQPLTTAPTTSTPAPTQSTPTRRRLPDTRQSITHRAEFGGEDFYFTIGRHPDGAIGEAFITANKQGTMVRGLLDVIGILFSLAVQYGVPVDAITRKLIGQSFGAAGFTGYSPIPYAASIADYFGRYLQNLQSTPTQSPSAPTPTHPPAPTTTGEGPPCTNCGTTTQRAGTCYLCPNCGTTTGCGG